MRFERSELTATAKSTLVGYQGEYLVNDGTDEKIVIGEDGTPVLHTGGKSYTPLYYDFNDYNWLAGNGELVVKSVVFSTPNWFDANKAAQTADRETVTMKWSAENKQFTSDTADTFYEPGGGTVSRAYSKTTTYSTQASIDEAKAYMTQYVKGEYTLNDGPGWKIRVDDDGKIFTQFGAVEYEVKNPAPAFVQDDKHPEYGNNGKYLSTIAVPVTGWYSDEDCIQEAILKLTWNGNKAHPIDNHQFSTYTGTTSSGITIYRKNELECKYLVGTFYSDADREAGVEFL